MSAQRKAHTPATLRRELVAFKRRVKRAAVDAGRRGWLTPEQAKFLINALGLRND